MSPFSQLLHDLRMRYGLRQAELAERIGYEQSYISALEVGLKGPPTSEFLLRVAETLELTAEERQQLQLVAQASQRKLVIDADAPSDVYWLLNDLRSEVDRLTPAQVRLMREVIAMTECMGEGRQSTRRLKRRRKEEAPM